MLQSDYDAVYDVIVERIQRITNKYRENYGHNFEDNDEIYLQYSKSILPLKNTLKHLFSE